jgi:hypothetical protein
LRTSLTLERDAVGTMLGHGFHPLKARHRWSIQTLRAVHPEGRTPIWGQHSTPIDTGTHTSGRKPLAQPAERARAKAAPEKAQLIVARSLTRLADRIERETETDPLGKEQAAHIRHVARTINGGYGTTKRQAVDQAERIRGRPARRLKRLSIVSLRSSHGSATRCDPSVIGAIETTAVEIDNAPNRNCQVITERYLTGGGGNQLIAVTTPRRPVHTAILEVSEEIVRCANG